MKKRVALLLVLAMVLSFASCGKPVEDPIHAGVYHGILADHAGATKAMSAIYAGETRLELMPDGKGNLVLDGIDFPLKWVLREEELTLTIQRETYTGTLKDGIVVIEPMGLPVVMTFVKEDLDLPPTYNNAGYWEIVRIDSEDPKLRVSEENIYSASKARYLELNPDGTGKLFLGTVMPLTWQDGMYAWRNGTSAWCDGYLTLSDEEAPHTYTLAKDELKLDMTDYVLVFRRVEMWEPRDPSKALTAYDVDMEVGEVYPYTTGTYKGEDLTTVAEAKITRYEIFESSEDHPPREGYEWRVVEMEVHFCDKNADRYGVDCKSIFTDYYNSELCDSQAEIIGETDTYVLFRYPIVYQGQQMEVDAYCMFPSYGEWYWVQEKQLVEIMCYVKWEFQVPVGYDGCIAGVMDSRLDWIDGTYITDYNPNDFRLFRAY